jgi:pimeloyl-ACP methyl ester carboxylesterase
MNKAVERVTSADGTPIAFDRLGDGPPVVLVGAALQDRAMYRPLVGQLARRFTVFNYDRRGRGDSGDTTPYAIEREIEDIEALMDEAGGTASVYGHSSGAGLVLHAAASGLPVARIALHEPPYTPEDEEQKRASREDAETIVALLAEGRRGDAVAHILGGIGLPQEAIDGMVQDERVVAMAHTLAYDSEIMGDISRGGTIPEDVARAVTVPALVLCGGASPAWMIDAGKRAADAMPEGYHRILEGQEHFAPPEVLAPVLTEFFERDGAYENAVGRRG